MVNKVGTLLTLYGFGTILKGQLTNSELEHARLHVVHYPFKPGRRFDIEAQVAVETKFQWFQLPFFAVPEAEQRLVVGCASS